MRLTRFAILALMFAALGLTACGRAGSLEPPPGYEKDKEDEPFVLDPLIDPDGPKPSN